MAPHPHGHTVNSAAPAAPRTKKTPMKAARTPMKAARTPMKTAQTPTGGKKAGRAKSPVMTVKCVHSRAWHGATRYAKKLGMDEASAKEGRGGNHVPLLKGSVLDVSCSSLVPLSLAIINFGCVVLLTCPAVGAHSRWEAYAKKEAKKAVNAFISADS